MYTYYIGNYNDADGLYIKEGDWSGTTLFTILSGGNVGIGTTNPVEALQIGSAASSSTSSPNAITLGGEYSDTAGANPKLIVYESGSDEMGLGVSAG